MNLNPHIINMLVKTQFNSIWLNLLTELLIYFVGLLKEKNYKEHLAY